MRARRTISARLYANGLGVPKDNVKVLMWYTVALPGLRGEEATNAPPSAMSWLKP